MKIPVKHYIEIAELTSLEYAIVLKEERELVNEGGKLYFVEVWL